MDTLYILVEEAFEAFYDMVAKRFGTIAAWVATLAAVVVFLAGCYRLFIWILG